MALPQMEGSVTYQAPFGLSLHVVFSKIKHSCQALCWSPNDAVINVLGVSCFGIPTTHPQAELGNTWTEGLHHKTSAFQAVITEGASGEGINCSFLHGEGMRFIREAQRSYTG